MSDEERRDSLADQAAAWVPPWERPTPPATSEKPAEPEQSTATPAEPEPSVPASAGADPEILETYRSARTETVQDPVGESAAEPEVASGSGEPAAAAPSADETIGPDGLAHPDALPSGFGDGLLAEADALAGGLAHSEARSGEPEGERGAGGVPGKRGRRRPEPEPAPVLDDAELRGALEAILLVVDQPVSELTLAQVLEQSPERIGPMLDEIAAGYTAAGHGFELRRAAGGWRLYTRPEYATYVERFVLEGQTVRLTQAALETLAVIAYKQPVTRSRISAIRGVNCDGVIRTLVTRGLVEECGTEADSGAFLYRTTTMFLEKLGLNSVDDLPPLAPFLPDDVEELADATR
ncbi:SMC-Scp complex subunit ScpB [Micromonospora sp. AMSO31t]|uniref:SMC-Scp complex subunit ScpB n=1 Tax=Micromonospora sp. AMSO31t TaxID=2650566 RepID=UPI00124B988D|nr:SMC-Scp complex subunit ScpB [Micromonospora sp. AMSO31t]KAB1911431.1 SMC-Scp complex subunit ScpB [Micromonospora sp. AMSO31t]